MTNSYLVNFCRSVPCGFRASEMNGLSKLFGFPQDLMTALQDETKPYVVCGIEKDQIEQLLSRSVLVKSVTEIYAQGETFDQLKVNLMRQKHRIESLVTPSTTFAIWVDAVGKKLDQKYKVDRIEELSFLNIQGEVNLDNPKIHFHLLEYCGQESSCAKKELIEIFFGRLYEKGRLRTLPSSYGLKARNYIGNTSMDPLFSFVASNLAAIGKNSIVYDPFVGTGSLLLPVAHFGAYCFGNDINYNTIFGRGKSSRAGVKIKQHHENIQSNFEQYRSINRFLGVLLADSSRNGFLHNNSDRRILDAVITDPESFVEGGSNMGCSGMYIFKVAAQINRADAKLLGIAERFIAINNLCHNEKFLVLYEYDVSLFSLAFSVENAHFFFIYLAPYGIREKASKVGPKHVSDFAVDSTLAESHSLRYPSKVNYSFYDSFLDLLNMAASHLRVGGRLVYWLPILYKDFDDACIPQHKCLVLVCKCEQKLSSSHGRLLICMEKITDIGGQEEKAYVLKNTFQRITLRDQVLTGNNIVNNCKN